MPRLGCMLRSPCLPFHRRPTNIAPNTEPGGIRKIMPPLQHRTQLHRSLQHHLIQRIKDLGIEIRRCETARVRRIRGAQRNDIVMNPRIHEDTPRRPPLVEAVHPQRLHVNGADLDVEVLAQNVQLDEAAPGVLALDPAAVGVGLLVEDGGGVVLGTGLDVLRDDGAQLVHVVHGAEVGGVEGAEEAGIVVGHDAEEEGGGVGGERELGGFGGHGVGFSGEGEGG